MFRTNGDGGFYTLCRALVNTIPLFSFVPIVVVDCSALLEYAAYVGELRHRFVFRTNGDGGFNTLCRVLVSTRPLFSFVPIVVVDCSAL